MRSGGTGAVGAADGADALGAGAAAGAGAWLGVGLAGADVQASNPTTSHSTVARTEPRARELVHTTLILNLRRPRPHADRAGPGAYPVAAARRLALNGRPGEYIAPFRC